MWQPNRTPLRSNRSFFTRQSLLMILKWVVLLGIFAGISLGLYWVFARWLIVKNITCYTNEQQLSPEECSAAQTLVGKSMLFTRFDEPNVVMQMQKVTASNRLIYYSHLRKYLPNQLKLFYEVSQPVYLVSSDQTTWAAVNKQGALKVMDDPGHLPKVFSSEAWGTYSINGQVADIQSHHFVMNFLTQAEQHNRPIIYIGLDARQQVSVVFQDGRRILVTGTADPAIELTRLKLIEQESAKDERFKNVTIKEIDLRFKFPVIRT